MITMKLLATLVVLPIVTLLAGCGESYYYVATSNESSTHIYDGKMDAWPRLPGFGNASVMGPVCIPVPDKVTISWKTALPGGEEYLENIDSMPPIGPDGVIPTVELYPEDKFKDHKATVVLKDKVPKYLKGELILVLRDGDKIDVSYVEKKYDWERLESE